MEKLLIASHNINKINEFKDVLKNFKIEMYSLKDLDDYEEVLETGKTFKENAFIKAEYYGRKHNMLTISDDSGLEVESLNNRPGIHSKRYSNNGDDANNKKILMEMKEETNRKARFKTVLCLYNPKGNPHYFEGVMEGEITTEPKGNEGFGYDPIFLITKYNKTFAELGNSIKNQISHRAKALMKFKEFIDENFNNE